MPAMTESAPVFRPATPADLPTLNRVVEAAVMRWDLPERVKRLALPSYRYTELDMAHLTLVMALDDAGLPIGVAAWEPATSTDCPPDQRGLLLHGLYVDPDHWHQGWGSRLLEQAMAAVAAAGLDGLLVKAQADAVGFFTRHGFTALPALDAQRHYANRLWRTLAP